MKKVENRLCSSKTAASEVKNAIAWLLSEEGAKLGATPAGSKAQGVKAGTKVKSERVIEEDEDEDEDEDENAVSIPRRVVLDSDSEGDDEAEADDAGWESGSVSGGDDGDEDIPRSGQRSKPTIAPADSDDDDDISLSPKPKAKKTKKTKPEPAPATGKKQQVTTSSTFLPSLSTGFTRGGSDDSDPDDDVGEGLEDVIGKGKGGERKNRRGQRARQMYVSPSRLPFACLTLLGGWGKRR